jgi:hypothetical protein
MLDCRISNKEWKFPGLHETNQQESVLTSPCNGIERTSRRVCSRPTDGESCCVQIPNAAVGLQRVILNCHEPKFFGSANGPRTVSDKVELKKTMLRRLRNRRRKHRQTVGLKFAVSVYE